MAESSGRYSRVGKLARVGLTVAMLAVLIALGITVALMVSKMTGPQWSGWDLIPYLFAILGELTLLFVLLAMLGAMNVIVANEAAVYIAAGRLRRVETLLSDQSGTARQLVDLASLSDRAKSLIFREREIEALSEAVHHEMTLQDYDTAEALVRSVEENLGYGEVAAGLREEVDASRKSTTGEKIEAAINRIDRLVEDRQWIRAHREADRLMKFFPNDEKVASLPQRIETSRALRKRELLHAYDEAVRKKDVEQSIELLKELDAYLGPQEAAALEESARSVFKAKLHNLGVQFSICVTDKNWAKALEVGREIVRDYPNTRMAHEVEEKMGLLEARAGAATQPNA